MGCAIWAALLLCEGPEAVSVHRRRLSDEGAGAGLSRKQRKDRRKQRVSPIMHNSRHHTSPPCSSQPQRGMFSGVHLIHWLPILRIVEDSGWARDP